jgi:hypothetical protein
MFIIIEGTDASGKSSLIDAINSEVSARFPERKILSFHKGKPGEETRRWVLNDYVTSIENYDLSDNVIVSDRWHWGEVTYAPLMRAHTDSDGYGLLGQAGWRWTELFLASRGATQFLLYQPAEVVKSRLARRGDDYVSVSDIDAILDNYVSACGKSIHTAILSPEASSLGDIPKLAKRVVKSALNREIIASDLSRFPRYIGAPNPVAILVGDQRNIVKRYGEETKLPFMPVDGNSGEFLLTALPEDSWKYYGILNINEWSADDFDSLMCTLGFPKVIALGRLAEKGLLRAGLSDGTFKVVPHPQFVRRFANSKKEEYGQAIVQLTVTDSKEHPWILR